MKKLRKKIKKKEFFGASQLEIPYFSAVEVQKLLNEIRKLKMELHFEKEKNKEKERV